jgi:4-hydroxyphenylacetate 3-monooxygenase
VFQNYQSQIRLVVKLKFLVGIARKLTETIGTSTMPQVREQLGRLAANVGMVEAMLHGMEVGGEHYGKYWIPNRHYLYSSQVVTQELYPKMINAIHHASVLLPGLGKFGDRAADPQDPTLLGA